MQPSEVARAALEIAQAALNEDRFNQDATSNSVLAFLDSKQRSLADREFYLGAKADGVFCGEHWIRAISEISRIPIELEVADGEILTKGRRICRGRGSALKILSIERTLLNELQHLCGIATQTRAYIQAVDLEWKKLKLPADQAPGIYHTRKTLPLHRTLQISAVLAGGGREHRRDLSERILVKENHKYLVQDLGLNFMEYLSFLKQKALIADALIEVESIAEAVLVQSIGGKNLLLDNFTPDQVREALTVLDEGVSVEVSGGLNLKNLAPYVIPGVSRLSIGALTHSVIALDISLDWSPV